MDQTRKHQENEYSFPYHYIPEFKNGFSQTVIWTWGLNYASSISFILDEIQKEEKNISSIIDVGCGDGRLTKELSLQFRGKDIIGIDYSSHAINLAQALNPNCSFLNKDIINEEIYKKYDAITLIEVFEHIPLNDCEKFVSSLHQILNDKGLIFLTVPHKNKKLSYKHFQHFNYDMLVNYFGNYFEIEKVVYFEKLSIWNKILKSFLVNKIYILNNKKLNNLVYFIYKKYLFYAKENNCGRIYLKMRKK